MNATNLIEDIKEKINLRDYIAQYTEVNGKGMAVCPIHKDANPSLKIYDNQSWYCFGCIKGGSIFDFVMALENLTFSQAIDKLSFVAGIDQKGYKTRGTSSPEFIDAILTIDHSVELCQKNIEIVNDELIRQCHKINDELRPLYNLPISARDHKSYTKILILEQKFNWLCDKGDEILDNLKIKLAGYKETLRITKRGK